MAPPSARPSISALHSCQLIQLLLFPDDPSPQHIHACIHIPHVHAECGTAGGAHALITISNSCVREAGFAPPASLGYGDDSGIRKNQALYETSRITIFASCRPTGVLGGTSWLAWWQTRCGAESRWHIRCGKVRTADGKAPNPEFSRGFAMPLWRDSRRYSSILYFNARVPHLEPDFRLVLDSFGVLSIDYPAFLLPVRHTTRHRVSVLLSWQALFLRVKPPTYIRQARKR